VAPSGSRVAGLPSAPAPCGRQRGSHRRSVLLLMMHMSGWGRLPCMPRPVLTRGVHWKNGKTRATFDEFLGVQLH
jgi:hypothetical protein